MPTTIPSYEIRRIWLINFHNFVDELIELKHGGHLFLLGDNGSGKTTVLDAVHYVLTAGDMELNAAARVVGRQAGGRRMQGVVMRFNVDTGALNKNGGITYAVLEIAGRQGKPLTVGVGISTRSMDESIKRWGFIRECPMDDIQLIVEDLQGMRPVTQEELRQQLGGGYYGNIGTYAKELSRRLFGGVDLFQETCRLLHMGKAYREIVSKAGDYHELFRRLLPEPSKEIFQRIVETLADIDNSQAELSELQKRLTWLQDLAREVEGVHKVRLEQHRYEWLEAHLQLENCRKQVENAVIERETVQSHLADLNRQIDDCKIECDRLDHRLADLRSRDASGLVRQEKELATEVTRVTGQLGSHDKAVREAERVWQEQQRQLDLQRKALIDTARRLHQALSRLVPDIPFSVADLVESLATAMRSDTPEDSLATLYSGETQTETQHHQEKLNIQLGQLEESLKRQAQLAEELEGRISQLREQGEAEPDLPGFHKARLALRDAMASAVPLYEGLEWQPKLDRKVQAAIEELIGADVLATFLVRADELEVARDVLVRDFPGLRLGRPDSGDNAVPEWIRHYLDIPRSDPRAIACLAAEMLSEYGPEVTEHLGHRVLGFRAHDVRLSERSARLIGIESRREALRRQIADLEKQLKQNTQEQRELERQKRDLTATKEKLTSLVELLTSDLSACSNQAHEVRRLTTGAGHAQSRVEDTKEKRDELANTLQHYEARLQDLRALIAQEGLDQLERQISRLQRQLEKERTREADLQRQSGADQRSMEELDHKVSSLGMTAERLGVECEEAAARLLGLDDSITDVAYYVLRTWRGAQFRTVDAVRIEHEKSKQTEVQHQTAIRERSRHPTFGSQYGMYYDGQENDLRDRRSVPVAGLCTTQETTVAEQESIINEKTNNLFRQVIMNELLQSLRGHITKLDDMLKRINRRLEERQFGNQRYRFRMSETESCRRLVRIVRELNLFDPKTGDELRQFFEEHHREIKATAPGEIPDLLDYRNWFHYDLAVSTLDEEGVVMDRRTKSLGSGGEQAVPNYLLILTIADFHYTGNQLKLPVLLFDEAFYGIDSGRRDQLLGFASALGLQLFVASPDQDGVKQEIAYSTTVLIVKDEHYRVHLYPYDYRNPKAIAQPELLDEYQPDDAPIEFKNEINP